MLALRLTRAARPAVQLRRLLVAAAAAGTAFLLLACLGYALGHPDAAGPAAMRLAWCAVPLAATVYFAVAVARTDPATRPRPGLSAVGLGPARLMAVSALSTALACALGSALALLFFLRLRGDLTGMPFGGAAADFLAADQPLPLPAALTLLALVPAVAAAAVALALRPRDPRPTAPAARGYGRFGAYGDAAARETFGAYGRFGARFGRRPAAGTENGGRPDRDTAAGRAAGAGRAAVAAAAGAEHGEAAPDTTADPAPPAPDTERGEPEPASLGGAPATPAGLPWGVALLAAGLAAHAYAGRVTPGLSLTVLPGWVLTASGLVLASPGLTHLCGRLLQSVRPGVLRLLAGRVLMAEAARVGRPLGVVCAVGSAGCAVTALYGGDSVPFSGPLTTLGGLVVAGCTVATLFTAAVEARQCRADTVAALLRLGAPAMLLRAAAALRAAALLALFAPLTLAVAVLSALPVAR
ncbi:hypothetical protein D9753_09875 [Streptomyces dangxiongensis]|uniref:Uncharacterized protein n=1 Tax=Streptomyces dangxiongensis TaxID=1442032 RepID=A0A3G2JF70_9ACTN|nr:hypothetical protein [Streptomyces dangxiongensis]AYN39162.1 hypothetical protein D9753_09875 [Streptomyces dangxiongensis]